VTVGVLSTKSPQRALRPYTKSMKQTKMTHDEIIAMVMADYTAKMIAEEKRRQEILAGTYIPCPVPTSSWNISDRH